MVFLTCWANKRMRPSTSACAGMATDGLFLLTGLRAFLTKGNGAFKQPRQRALRRAREDARPAPKAPCWIEPCPSLITQKQRFSNGSSVHKLSTCTVNRTLFGLITLQFAAPKKRG
jgi:hypothetical protein